MLGTVMGCHELAFRLPALMLEGCEYIYICIYVYIYVIINILY